MDKTTTLFAAVERLAEKTGDDDLLEYLRHASQHSSVFLEEIDAHHAKLADLDAFKSAHEAATSPQTNGAQASYSKAEVDAMIAAAIKKAKG